MLALCPPGRPLFNKNMGQAYKSITYKNIKKTLDKDY
jgi:hypothetical protein